MEQSQQQEGHAPHAVVGEALEVDLDSVTGSDVDSALGDTDKASISTSLTSKITNFRVENGRRYHAFDEDVYALPNDDQEIGRLDIQHHVWRLCLNGKLHLAPLSEHVQDVLDIGTGTGQWAIEFADQHPSATVLGTDLSPIQPAWTPPNCSFLIDNAEDEWIFDKQYDFIRSRMLLFGLHDWEKYFQQTFKNLKPGGWMEVHEPEFPLNWANTTDEKDAPFAKWSRLISEAGEKCGIDTMITKKFPTMIEKQGFVNIRHNSLQWPMGTWPKGQKEKVIGRWMIINTNEFLDAIALSWYTKYLGWKKEDVEAFLVDVRKDMYDPAKYYYWQLHIYSAQKPQTAT
ncbi:S-adenosyl-L-methionine-dependent methyltransferase [Rhizodiscina lignyota]|uniref:S-adenosyl-L-methionine-dependent methyltransferase n=1 Tax=Rhizodiscina lignyota TaxID=1504668 RepID=A0A9P4I482_9PEZI|nr:S-adenosyl-L-methionine-dependent methyltransferase [Rhizodiscina lignyota]